MTIKGVDLLPTEKKQMTLDPIIFLMVILIVCSVGVFWIFGKQYEKKIEDYKGKIAEVETQIKEIESKIPEVDTIKNDIERLKNQRVAIEEKSSDPKIYRNILKQISEIIPVSLYLTRLDIEPGSNKISMSATSVAVGAEPPLYSIACFIKNIQSSDIFSNVSIGSASQVKNKDSIAYNFNIDFNFNREKAAGIDREQLFKSSPQGGGAR